MVGESHSRCACGMVTVDNPLATTPGGAQPRYRTSPKTLTGGFGQQRILSRFGHVSEKVV